MPERGLNLVITVPADVLAPTGARSSTGTVLTEKLLCHLKWSWKSCNTLSANILSREQCDQHFSDILNGFL